MHNKAKKYIVFFLLFFVIGGFVVGVLPQPAKAQWITMDGPSLTGWISDKLYKVWQKIDSQILATAFKKSLGTFLNKLAYDSAVYVAAGGTGQKGLVNPFKGNYMLDLAEATTGEFIDELAQKSGLVGDPAKLQECLDSCPKDANGKMDVNCSEGCKQSTGGAFGTYSLCEPVDLTMKANLLMSFKKPKEPPAPKCSLTKMAKAAQESAKDDLLEFNAGYEESEGGFNITFRSINDDQVFQGTQAQKDLTGISDSITKLLADLDGIMKEFQGAIIVVRNTTETDKEKNMMNIKINEHESRLDEMQAEFLTYIGQLTKMTNEANECIATYEREGAFCGNNVANGNEMCDYGNNPFCTSSCKLATSVCTGPGGIPDGTKDSSEVCDTTVPANAICELLGYAPGGTVTCNNDCYLDISCIPKTVSSTCTQMAECKNFIATVNPETTCVKAATTANQYAVQLLSSLSAQYSFLENLNKQILDGTFNAINTNPQDIANAFNPEANEMGQFGKIQETLSQKTQDQLEHEKLKTLAEGPCKGVTKPITGEVVTPSAATCAAINEALAKSTKGQETFTGTFADAFGVFVNTLTSKLMERYFKKGLSMVFNKDGLKDCKGGKDICGDKTEDILKSGASLGGKAAAEKALGSLLDTSIETGGQQDILSILAACPPEQPALNNCIIDEPLRRAIEKQFTVKEAMEAYKKSGGSEGLDPKKPFGYILVGAAMDEPDFKNGYPYRSMLYLRKYRIIPVGWELAAQYIKNIENPKQIHTLDDMINGFDDPASPFFGLVDPAWILKAPAVFCAKQGPGPELLSMELMCEKINAGSGQCESDDYQSRKVSRKTWCADEQTCLEEGESGDCKRYGYCTLEKSSWKLGGTQCDKPFASCEGYTNSITKTNYTVLENTLNKADCNQSNVGCQWYCQDAPKMCKGGTRGGQPCGVNNDCASIYCSVGTCVNSGIACSYDNDCGSGATGFCSNNNAISCTTATVGTDCGAGNQCILCNTGARACVNGDTPGAACANNAQCGRGVVDGVCEEGGVWSCRNTGTCSNNNALTCTKATEIAVCGAGNVCNLTGDRINLDRDVKKCEAKDAGCNQFIKVQPGANLIGNSGFEDDVVASMTINRPSVPPSDGYLNKWYLKNASASDVDMKASIDDTTVHSGKNSLYIEMDSAPNSNGQGLWMSDNTLPYSVVPTGFVLSSEKTYTVSAWIYNRDAGDANGDDDPDTVIALDFGDFTAGLQQTAKTNQLSPQWERVSVTIPPGTSPDQIRIYPSKGGNPIRFYIDDLQLEEGDTASNYVQYGSSNQAYLNGRRLQCEKQEVGCNLYSPSDGGDPIPAVIKVKDQCPVECAGYAPFYQMPSFFEPTDDPSDYPNIIPASGVSCSASSMGCEEFTNLDTVASGGEVKEYYTKLRQCAKPGTTTEATFYTWEGSEEAGFQLRAWRFKSVDHDSNIATPMRPYVTDNNYNCADLTNPDCRTFYDQNGVTFSEELSSTVFISTDCHPLRKTIQGTRKDCLKSGGRTDAPVVLGDPDIVTCFYDAIPSQGLKCTAKEAGCREYRGSAGNNLRVLLNDDFEDLTSQSWTPSSLSSESLTVGGRSYNVSYNIGLDAAPNTGDDVYTAKKNVSDLMTQDKVYVLEFWAKRKNPADATAALNARFFNGAGNILILQKSKVSIDEEWNQYSLGPMVFSRAPASDGTETLEIFPTIANDGSSCNPGMGGGCIGEYYLDNIVLREITDNPYLIKDSWKTPLSCDLDPTDPAYVSNALEADLTATEVGVIDLYNSGGFPNALAGGGTIVIDGEAIKYTDSGGGNLTAPLLRGVHGTTAVAHSKDAIVQLLDEGAQLDCKEYTDRFNQKTYLRSFDKLCGEDKVGCTEMINSYNSRSMYEQTTKGEYIPRDAVEYIVDNPKLYCNASFKGCEKMGQPALGQSNEISSWGETYLINDPDQYAQIACESSENMCSEFTTRTGGTTYFKDPQDALCEYHSSINIEGTITKGWFKKGVIPAALGGLVFYDSDGDAVNDTYAHLECATVVGAWDETKWTYSCPNDQVGCTEYQAPLTNILKAADQHIFANCSTGCAIGLSGASIQVVNSSTFKYRFDILEEGDYELTLSTQNFASGASEPSSFGQLHELDIYVDGILKKQLNGASTPSAPLATSVSAQITPAIKLGNLGRGQRIITIHWPAANDWCAPIGVGGCPNSNSNLQLNYLVIGKSAGAKYYNLEQGVDTASCMGVIDPEKGCVAFYDATNPSLSINSSAVSGNAFAPAACQKCSKADSCDSLPTCDPTAGNCCCNNTAVITSPCDANTILKVRADRQCAEWLACTDSEKTTDSKGNMIEMCKARKACRKVGDGVECASDGWIDEIKRNQTFDDPVAIDIPPHASVIADAALRSGYFKAGAHWAKGCSHNPALNCQVDSDCGAGNTCDDQVKAVSNNIEGYYPYAAYDSITGFGGMTPVGELYNKIIAFEDDFEAYQSGELLPQCSVNALQPGACVGDDPATPADEDTCRSINSGICLNYWGNSTYWTSINCAVLPCTATSTNSVKATNKEFKFGGQSLLVLKANVAGNEIISRNIFVNNTGNYVFTVWLNTKDLQGTGAGALNRLIAEVDSGGIKATAFQEESNGWKKYVIPFTAGAGTANIRVYMQNVDAGNPIKEGSKAYVDMISLAPVLELQSPTSGESYSDRSCRIYAKPDALTCKYRERSSGREIQGWRGFCAESDPKNPEYCLQWWPIDLISGEDISKF